MPTRGRLLIIYIRVGAATSAKIYPGLFITLAGLRQPFDKLRTTEATGKDAR